MKRFLSYMLFAALVALSFVASPAGKPAVQQEEEDTPTPTPEPCNVRNWQITFLAYYDFAKAAEAALPRPVEFEPFDVPAVAHVDAGGQPALPVAIAQPATVNGQVTGSSTGDAATQNYNLNLSTGIGVALPSMPVPPTMTLELVYEPMNEALGSFLLSMIGRKHDLLSSPADACVQPLNQATIAWMSQVEKAYMAAMRGEDDAKAQLDQTEVALQQVRAVYAGYGGSLDALLALIGY